MNIDKEGEQFDLSRKNWKIVDTEDENVNTVLDGIISTTWLQRAKKNQSIL